MLTSRDPSTTLPDLEGTTYDHQDTLRHLEEETFMLTLQYFPKMYILCRRRYDMISNSGKVEATPRRLVAKAKCRGKGERGRISIYSYL